MKLSTYIGLAVFLFHASPIQALDNEPGGIGEVTFGMSVEAAKKHFPKLAPLVANQQELAYYTAGAKTSFESLEGCTPMLLFLDDQFYQVALDCDARDKVAGVLKEKFGEPTTQCGGKPAQQTWVGAKATVRMNCETKVFHFGDNALVAKADAYVKGQRQAAQKKAAEKKAAKKPTGKAN